MNTLSVWSDLQLCGRLPVSTKISCAITWRGKVKRGFVTMRYSDHVLIDRNYCVFWNSTFLILKDFWVRFSIVSFSSKTKFYLLQDKQVSHKIWEIVWVNNVYAMETWKGRTIHINIFIWRNNYIYREINRFDRLRCN